MGWWLALRRVGMYQVWLVWRDDSGVFCGVFSVGRDLPAEILQGGPAGAQAPQVHDQLARQADDDLVAPPLGRSFIALLALHPRPPPGLEADQSPGRLHQVAPHGPRSGLGDGQAALSLAAAVFSGHQPKIPPPVPGDY